MTYLVLKKRFYGAWDAMVNIYTQYPSITPVTEEQIEDDLIPFLKKWGFTTDDCTLEDDDFTLVETKICSGLILRDVKEALQHG